MNYSDRYLRTLSTLTPQDILLAEVAARIQLSPTDYQLAVDHYNAIHQHIEREGSPLFGMVEEFYVQGGFAINATVARHASDDEFDLDAMIQLTLRVDVDPEWALSTLDRAIRGERGSRYYDKCERKTRCSTVNYDGMHVDVTPTVRLQGLSEKTGYIFHSKPEDPNVKKKSLYANPFGFARWFNQMTPPDQDFAAFFESISLDQNRARLLAKADATPVPVQAPAYRKSRAVIALQLIKRWRNLAYDRHHPSWRLPPSVLQAFYVGSNAGRTTSLSAELAYQVDRIRVTIATAHAQNRLVHAANPACPQDVLTDRWPGSLTEQKIFLDELEAFAKKLRRFEQEGDLEAMQKILIDLFGEKPSQGAVHKYVERYAGDIAVRGGRTLPGKAAIPAALSGIAAAPRVAQTAPAHKFYGDDV